ncbi:unnamed protein product [Boreogadus saida]
MATLCLPITENDVDGETVNLGLTEAMVLFLLEGSFKKQIQFRQFVQQYKEGLEPVPVPIYYHLELQPLPQPDPRYPTNAEYTQVAKALVLKYPLLRDVEGNGYEIGVGEDSSTIEAHVNVLKNEYLKTQPELSTVNDPMVRTFPWRRREIMDGMTVEDVLIKYPHLRTPARLFNEVDRIHRSQKGFSDRFRGGFASVLTNVLQLAKGKSPIAKQYNKARQDALAEDLPGIDFRAGLILLPVILKEKVEHLITMGEGDPATPYPTIRLLDNDWKMAIEGRALNVVKVDGVDVCQCTGIEDGFITAFSMP